MNKKLAKKLAYKIASMAFNSEVSSTIHCLASDGFEISFEDALIVTELAEDLFDAMAEKAEGWRELAEKYRVKDVEYPFPDDGSDIPY